MLPKSGRDPSCRVAPFVSRLSLSPIASGRPMPPVRLQGSASSVKPQGPSRPSPADRLGSRLAPRSNHTGGGVDAARPWPGQTRLRSRRRLRRLSTFRPARILLACRCLTVVAASGHTLPPTACRGPPEPSAARPPMMPISGLPTETYPARVSMRARPRHAPGISCPNPSRCRRHSRQVPAVRRGGPSAAATHRLADVAHLGHTHAALSRDRVPADGPRCSRLSARPQDHA